MSKRVLQPQGNYPKAGFWKRLAAMFYDFMLCIALVMVVTMIYHQGVLRLIYGSEPEMADKMPDIDLSISILFLSFCFFASSGLTTDKL